MDTKTLEAGQDVYMVSGVYCEQGKVIAVTPSGFLFKKTLLKC